jgi:hypothetical protein
VLLFDEIKHGFIFNPKPYERKEFSILFSHSFYNLNHIILKEGRNNPENILF